MSGRSRSLAFLALAGPGVALAGWLAVRSGTNGPAVLRAPSPPAPVVDASAPDAIEPRVALTTSDASLAGQESRDARSPLVASDPPRRIHGRVRRADGASPGAGLLVLLWPEGSEPLPAQVELALRSESCELERLHATRTDAEGRFAFDAVPWSDALRIAAGLAPDREHELRLAVPPGRSLVNDSARERFFAAAGTGARLRFRTME